jgi:hypothetical protein
MIDFLFFVVGIGVISGILSVKPIKEYLEKYDWIFVRDFFLWTFRFSFGMLIISGLLEDGIQKPQLYVFSFLVMVIIGLLYLYARELERSAALSNQIFEINCKTWAEEFKKSQQKEKRDTVEVHG